MIENFFSYADRKSHYSAALQGVSDFLDQHSASIKWCKINNIQGFKKILMALQEHIDEFMEDGGDTELTIRVIGEGKKSEVVIE